MMRTATHRFSGFRTVVRGGVSVRVLLLSPGQSVGQDAQKPVLDNPAPASTAPGPIVSVTGGRIQGRWLQSGTGAVFKGIPFAAPPAGDLRWREPQPVKSWSGLKQAADYGNACAQADGGWNKIAYNRRSEDCLYLNVWTPTWPMKAKSPVMMWIHGGGNNGGSAMGFGSIEPPFDGAALARRGVVVVSINYRLGIFGFMGHPELTAESPHHASGGYALLDQIAALHWIRANAATFGGDPANVTVFGQSAGAQDISILVTSPLAKGLFQKAITESGTPMIGDKRLQTPAQTEELGLVLAATLKAPAAGQIEFLRSLPSDQLIAALPEFRKGIADRKLILDVGMDGYVVPAFSPHVYRTGAETPIPMIMGTNGRDTPGYRPAGTTTEAIEAATRERIITFYATYPDLQQRALAAYGFTGSVIPEEPIYGPLDLQMTVDHGFRCEGTVLEKWHSAVAPTWSYEFNAGTPKHPPMHSGELDFVFGYLRDQAADPTLAKLSDQMQLYWTNFAKTGDPNGPGLPAWPRYDATARTYLEFGNHGPLQKANLRAQVCDIYIEKLTRDIASR